jgi:ABC-2 type transport system permease protein
MSGDLTRTARAEWTKLRSVRSTGWSLLGLFGLATALTAVVCTTNSTEGCVQPDCEDVVQLSLSGAWFGQLAVVGLAVLAITSEHATGMIRATFAALPRRRTVLAGKAAVLAAVVFAAGLATSVACFLVGRSLLPGSGFTPEHGYALPSLADAEAARAVVGTALYLAGVALLAFGVGAIVRHTAAAVTAALALLLGPLIVHPFLAEDAGRWLQKLSPMTGLAVQQTTGSRDFPIGPWAGLAVLGAYAAAAVMIALVLVGRRDA